ncbi:MAG: tetratricopeptide repeat protein [Kofleriaceae bacterium]|nr:tetratricopeptide repeat protein [Kofleriaceae bacterium]
MLELGREQPRGPAPASPRGGAGRSGRAGRGRSRQWARRRGAQRAAAATTPDELRRAPRPTSCRRPRPTAAGDRDHGRARLAGAGAPADWLRRRDGDARARPRACSFGAGAPGGDRPSAGTTPGGDVETAAALFERAERALAAGDRDGARAALRRLLDRFAGEPLADDARYQLARLARHDPPAALAYLDAIRSPSLAEPAAFLRCAVKADAGHADAATCLEAFRQTHPRSAHGDDALLRLAELHFRRGDCAGAAPLLADFLRRHPDHAQARARLARCQDPGAAR